MIDFSNEMIDFSTHVVGMRLYNNTGYWIPIGSLLQEDVEPYYRAYRLFSKMMEESPLQVNVFLSKSALKAALKTSVCDCAILDCLGKISFNSMTLTCDSWVTEDEQEIKQTKFEKSYLNPCS